MVENYVTNNLSNFLKSSACKSGDLIIIEGLEQASFINAIFLSIAKAKALLLYLVVRKRRR
jgi:hypothetical protein